jgi:hypothetical protein
MFAAKSTAKSDSKRGPETVRNKSVEQSRGSSQRPIAKMSFPIEMRSQNTICAKEGPEKKVQGEESRI